jgi:hypothetical protein
MLIYLLYLVTLLILGKILINFNFEKLLSIKATLTYIVDMCLKNNQVFKYNLIYMSIGALSISFICKISFKIFSFENKSKPSISSPISCFRKTF